MSPESVTQSAIGVILSVNGEVLLKSSEGLRVAESGSSVFRGDELVTGIDGQVEVRFVDDTLLSQGAESSISLDDYIYDEVDESSSDLFFKMGTGTFRMVTGKIAEQNPDRFKIGSPLATIGIRGTTTVHEIGSEGEKHGVEEIHSGRALLVQSIDGSLRQISSPRALVDIASSGMMSSVRTMTVAEFDQFQSIAPAAIQQEQIIQEQRDEEQQEQDLKDNDEQQGGEEAQGEEGAEPDADALGGEGVLSADAGVFAGLDAVDPTMLAAAEEIFEALAEGDVETVAELLEDFTGGITGDPVGNPDGNSGESDEDIDELVEGVNDGLETTTGGAGDNSSGDDTSSADDGIDWGDATENADRWTGTENTDYYDGRGGDDEIDGKESADTLKGGDGNDTIYGCLGDDSIEGGSGNDLIYGGVGRDAIDGGSGNDYIFALQDGDTIIGSTGNDTVSYLYVVERGVNANLATGTVSGGDYDDSLSGIENLVGTNSADTLIGDDAANILTGLSGADSIVGGLGDDRIYGDAGRDVIDGGAGDDYIYSIQDGDTIIGSTGTDTVSYVNLSGRGVNANLATGVVSGGDYDDSLSGIENLVGSGSSDVLVGDGAANTLSGLADNDSISGGSGNDSIDGGTGADTIEGGAGADTLDGGSGQDTFRFTEAEGLAGEQLQNFSSADDTIDFDSGNFSQSADFAAVSGSYGGTDAALGSGPAFIFDSDGKLWYDSNGVAAGGHTLISTVSGDSVTSSDITVDDAAIAGAGMSVTGTSGSDTLTGLGGNDYLDGAAGADLINGGLGNDTLLGGVDNDSISGGSGNDLIEGGAGSDTLDGGSGQDIFRFTEAEGLAGEQLQNFSSADDTIDFDSNSFSDTSLFLAVDGSYGGTDAGLGSGPAFVFDIDGKLWYDSNGVDAGGHTLISTVGGDSVQEADITVDGTAIAGSGVSWIYGAETGESWVGTSKTNYYDGRGGDDTIDGKQGVDTLLGGLGNDIIYGGNGTDSIDGGGGNDTIYGGQNADVINGGADDDIIFGGQNGDTMDGGDGNDTVSYEGGSAVQVDLAAGTVSGGSNTDILNNIENIIGTDNNDVLKGCSVSNSLTGGAGDDTLTGSGGVDYLSGGIGRDIFSYTSSSEGGDTISGFVSADDGFRFSSSFNSNFTFIDVTPGDGVTYDGQTGPADGTAYFVFDSDNGQLWYDPDGNSASSAHALIATVVGDDVVVGDIYVESGGMS